MVLAVITWIGREHELYSGTSPISPVEDCVTFRHDRRLLSLLGFVHNWPTSRWSATKKENRFSFNGNGIMSSFLGRQFYRSTLYVCLWVHVGGCITVCSNLSQSIPIYRSLFIFYLSIYHCRFILIDRSLDRLIYLTLS